MPETLYDTRYFVSLFGTKDVGLKKKLRAELEARRGRYVSAITIYEVCRLTLEDEGHEVARIRRAAVERYFEVIDVDSEIASEAAEIKVRQGRDFPLADAIIAATAICHGLDCFTDDEHIRRLVGLKTRWA